MLLVFSDFSDISPTESSRFHAMNLVGNVDQSLDSLEKTATALPNVVLVVLDDYCPESGHIPSDVVGAVNKLIAKTTWTTLLISKGGVSMEPDEPILQEAGIKLMPIMYGFLLVQIRIQGDFFRLQNLKQP